MDFKSAALSNRPRQKPDTTKYRKGERRTSRYHIVRAGDPRARVADPPVNLTGWCAAVCPS
jgi:hypothetical protein